MKIIAKICGLKTRESIITAQENGADFLGFVFYPPSPRHLTPQQAAELAHFATAKKVAVTVDANDALLAEIVESLQPDYIQLHGEETTKRAQQIKQQYGLGLIRSIEPNIYPEDSGLYDYLLVDAPKAELPGGNGRKFDWKNFTPPTHNWFLSGGLNAENIAEALKITQAKMVDISSGVEKERGIKDDKLIAEFLQKLREL